MKRRFLIVFNILFFTALGGCSQPQETRVVEKVCLPYFSFTPRLDPTLDAKNYPQVRKGATHRAEVGDTMIRRFLDARFQKGKLLSPESLLTSFPKEIAMINGYYTDQSINGIINQQEILTLTSSWSCSTPPAVGARDQINTADKNTLARLEVAETWIRGLSQTEAYLNTVLLPDETVPEFLYRAKNYQGAQYWAFPKPLKMRRKEAINWEPKYLFRLLGIWIQDNAPNMLVVDKYKLDEEEEITSVSIDLVPTLSDISIDSQDSFYSYPWENGEGFFDQRLIYNGLSGSTIKFLYREYSGDYNRSAFEQAVTYDLQIGELIGFKGARFRVLSASNIGIEYEVVKPFDKDGVYTEQTKY